MPLLKKKPFEKAPIPDDIRSDEEVFYCAMTNEIFRDYEDFSERMFLCNSMVWTCSMTGKSNLTYTEALESEEHAKNSLREFPHELKIPILYLASRTKRTAFSDMAEDVFIFAKDRFFIGENIETCFTDSKWKDSHVLQVISPPQNKFKTSPKNGSTEHRGIFPAASLYKYEIEHLDADDKDISEIMIVDCQQMRRKKGSFSKEKCKLFLKQCVEQDDKGIFIIKPSVLEAHGVNASTFDKIFDGPIPEFEASKKLDKVPNGKKTRQESLHKFLTKNPNNAKNENNINLLEKMKKREEEFKLLKEQRKEQLKQKKKEEGVLLAKKLKDFYKPKEDLELTDHQKLPPATPIKLKVSDEHLGDMFMILEFVHTFSKILGAKDFFPGGLTIEIMERALTENEVAGPLIDLVQMFLNALFNVQEQEASQYRIEAENPSYIKPEETDDNMNVREATRFATIASTWSKKYQGIPLGALPLYSLTTSEVLRLHLLSSGAIINGTGARWRYQQRGGYISEDDPGLHLRLHNPHILKALKTHNIVELPISDKLAILSCLINQLLTYADVRDVVEENVEKIKQAKVDYKVTLSIEKKREQEFLAASARLKKMMVFNSNVKIELEKLETENGKKKADNEWKLEQLRKESYERQVLMGQDRAFTKYLKLDSIPGLLVNYEEDNPGVCLNSVIEQDTHLVNASRQDIVAYIKKTIQDSSLNDKENSPSKSPKKVNGIHNGISEHKAASCKELMVCSSDMETCTVHSKNNENRTNWCFYYDNDTLNKLVDSLNKRGIREGELYQTLNNNRDELIKLISKTPIHSLNSEIETQDETKRVNKVNKAKYEDANLGYSNDLSPNEILHNALAENILEMEEKLFAGNLGKLGVKDREKWRNCLQNKNYTEFDKTLIKKGSDKTLEVNGTDGTTETNDYEDPGEFLNTFSHPVPDIDNNEFILIQKSEVQDAIQNLAIALAQVARAVEPKFLKKPLGRMSSGKNYTKKENIINFWEKSLLASTSFSQIFLHYSTLDSCVMWGKSVLLACCRICRRRNDAENMLLCDSCNLGHHLYCLKPKLKSVPTGDWFCFKCQKERKDNVPSVPVETPVKKRPIFRDEEESESDEMESVNGQDSEGLEEEEDDNDTSEMNGTVISLCKTCGSGGELICCEKCSTSYHIECAEPPLRRIPRGPWFCMSCKKINDRKRNHDRRYMRNAVIQQRSGKMNGQRRCAAQALYRIHDFAKSLRQMSESDDSSGDEIITKRTSRRDDSRSDLPLHNSELHAVLAEIMKDYNAWPFLRPVQKTEVPDYYDVITKPMDFGTIKYKLNMGEYREDSQFMSDALLVFQNCNTYNHTDDDVYKCGVQLLKHFQKKCRELGLKLPEELDYGDRPKKKIRTK